MENFEGHAWCLFYFFYRTRDVVKAFGSSPSSSLSSQWCFFYPGVSHAAASRDRKTLFVGDEVIFMIGQRRLDGKGNRSAAAAAAAAAAESYVSTPSGNDNDNASPGAAAAAAFYREGLCRLFFRLVAFRELETSSLRKFMDNL
jgi:hypothetical protein